MPRKWGGKAVKEARKKIARTMKKKKPGSTPTVRQRVVQDRLGARLLPLGRAVPGEKVKARPNENPQQMLARMKKQAKGPTHKGTIRKRD